jgi:hypothetical protein
METMISSILPAYNLTRLRKREVTRSSVSIIVKILLLGGIGFQDC